MSVASEKKVIAEMITLYCKKQHGGHEGALCEECQQLLDYAEARLSRCPFGDEKSFCNRCTIHCYKPDMRQRVKKVMAFSGPRMLFVHPLLLVKHALGK
ncbi:MAG: nitrous oxide-stimulated promoter family protein [Eubacterium sp.]|nr:nitrous oxide-stimulated promoter family protein [Eubacterium sp.]